MIPFWCLASLEVTAMYFIWQMKKLSEEQAEFYLFSGPNEIAKTPLPAVPAYRVWGGCESSARAVTRNPGRPEPTVLQLAPPSVLMNTPRPAAYSVRVFSGSTIRWEILTPSGNPELTAVQLAARSVLLNSPFSPAPAYSMLECSESTARE